MPVQYLFKRLRNFVVHGVLRLDDTPHRIAMGVAIGIFITWTPTIGLQMILVVALAAMLRANKAVGVPLVWISNPLTLVPIYGPNYWVGMKLLGGGDTLNAFVGTIRDVFKEPGTWWENVWAWFNAVKPFIWQLWTGSIIVGVVLGAGCYVLTYYGVIAYRRRHPHQPKVPTPKGDA